MVFIEIVILVVYSTLFLFAILFLLTTPNHKFYAKIIFAFFVCGVAVWGWAEWLLNEISLRSIFEPLTKIGFVAALISVQILLLLGLELNNIKIRILPRWFLFLLFIQGLFPFLQGFMFTGFEDKGNHINLSEGYGEMVYNTQILVFLIIILFLFVVAYKREDKIFKKRFSPFLIGFLITVLIGIFFNLFLPTVYNQEFYTALAPLSSLSIILGMAYSIYKWNFLGIMLRKNVSYAYIQNVWRKDNDELHQVISEKFFGGLSLINDKEIKIKKIVFPGGIINSKGNVRLISQPAFGFLKFFLSIVSFFSKKIFHIYDQDFEDIFIFSNFKPPDPFRDFIVRKLSPVAFYQRSSEKVAEKSFLHKEPQRRI